MAQPKLSTSHHVRVTYPQVTRTQLKNYEVRLNTWRFS